MSLWGIADLHLALGDKKKTMDVFAGWENYIEKIEKNWNNLIKPQDTVVIAGDVSWAMRLNMALEDFKFLENLPGQKILIKGNHDYWWNSRKKIDDFLYENNFKSINVIYNTTQIAENFAICGTRGWFCDSLANEDIKILNREVGRLDASIKKAKETNLEPIVFLHYPPIYSDFTCQEILSVLKKHKIKRCFYGHIHGKNAAQRAIIGNFEGINFDLISGDYLKFIPKLID